MPARRLRKLVSSDQKCIGSLRPDQRVEGAIQDEETCLPKGNKKTLKLKNGAEIEVGWGMAFWRSLEDLLDAHPDHFATLLTLACDPAAAVSPKSVAFLRRCLYLHPDGTIIPDERAVLLSAYQETAEGPVLVNPFVLDGPDEAQKLERREARGYRRLIRRLGFDDARGGP
jgi:hypothetical protein